MPLVNSAEIVARAYREGYAVPQLNTNGGNYDLSRAILEAAHECRSPIILGVYEKNAEYAGLPYIGLSLSALANQCAPDVPVALHLDHGSDEKVCRAALDAGFTSIMYDGSSLPIEENVDECARICEFVHREGASFEAELGQLLGGESDPDNPNLVNLSEVSILTDGVPMDMLAVAIGNSHGFYEGVPRLNMARLRQVRSISSVPLVLHGTTGLSNSQIKECIGLGMAKVNLGTVLRTRFVKHYVRSARELDHMGHPWRISRYVKDELKEECARFLELVGSAHKA